MSGKDPSPTIAEVGGATPPEPPGPKPRQRDVGAVTRNALNAMVLPAIAFGLALYAWLFFALTWFMEQNDVRRIDWVTTDAARAVLVRRAVLAARQRGDQDSIRKSDLRDALGRGLRPTFALRLLGARDVSASFLDRVTGQHIAELIAQGVLAPSTEASLSPRYLVAEDVSSELQP